MSDTERATIVMTEEECRSRVAFLAGLEPSQVAAYVLVIIRSDDHVRVSSPDPHESCLVSMLEDGIRVVESVDA